ncbi:phosphatases II [Xylaria nigripes]|nr:phosphatases II [Xylaria nigripes]
MASLLRQIVAGPRARHPEAGLDLCYVTDNIIATSGPSQTYPQRAYRNPLDRLVEFLDSKHGKNWAIWEFRAEGTGYPDELVYNRIKHYPWPDHHPPPFQLIPLIIASMRNWLSGDELEAHNPHLAESESTLAVKVLDALKGKNNERVAVVHCKAGKGRSGTVACSYLIAECGWTPEQAMARFTERRMRPNFGPGVSIPSQRRWLTYVDRWTKGANKYVDRELEIVEIHVWGLRHGVKLVVEGFVDQGKRIKIFHIFSRKERHIVEGSAPGGSSILDLVSEVVGYGSNPPRSSSAIQQQDTDGIDNASGKTTTSDTTTASVGSDSPSSTSSGKKLSEKALSYISGNSERGSTQPARSEPESTSLDSDKSDLEPGGMAVIFKPQKPIRIPNSDVNIGIERRSRVPKSVSRTMITAVAHVWFNAFFEGNGPEQDGVPNDSGIFEIDWDELDGIKGSNQKGVRAADRIAVVWRSIVPEDGSDKAMAGLPSLGTPVPQMRPADWKGNNDEDPEKGKRLGLFVENADDGSVGKSSSINEAANGKDSKGKGVDSGSVGSGLHDSDMKDEKHDSIETSSQLEGEEADDKESREVSLAGIDKS